MGRQQVRRTGQFEAVDDDGNTHVITVYTTFIEATQLSGPPEWIPGTKSHKMTNGNHVNVNDDGTLEDVHTGRVMRRKT